MNDGALDDLTKVCFVLVFCFFLSSLSQCVRSNRAGLGRQGLFPKLEIRFKDSCEKKAGLQTLILTNDYTILLISSYPLIIITISWREAP